MTKPWIVTVVALAALVATSAAAQASCARPLSLGDQIGKSPLVFVGTVAFASDNERVARVKVESIWSGPDLPAYADVHGSPVTGQFAFSSVDRTYRSGVRYLFMLFSARQPLQDNNCSATQVFTDELRAFVPAGARSPAPATFIDEIQNSSRQYWLPIVAVVLIALVAASIGMWRMRRSGARRG